MLYIQQACNTGGGEVIWLSQWTVHYRQPWFFLRHVKTTHGAVWSKNIESRITVCEVEREEEMCVYKRHARGHSQTKQTDRKAFIHTWNDTFLLTCILKINDSLCTHTHTQTQSESAMPKPKRMRGRTWDTEFSQSLGQYCSCVCLALSNTHTKHTHTYPFTQQQTHTQIWRL